MSFWLQKQPKYRLKLWTVLAAVVALLVILGSCVKKKQESEASGYSFKGITRLEGLSGGRWRVMWAPITAVTKVTYLVYQKEEGKSLGSFHAHCT